MNKVIAMYYMFDTASTPALIGLFTSTRKANDFLSNKDRRKYYMREYTTDVMLKD